MPDLSDSRTQYSIELHTQVANTSEQIIREFTKLRDLIHLDLDVDELTQTAVFKIFERVAGGVTPYTEVSSATYDPTFVTGDFDTDVKIIGTELDGGGQDMKVTLQSIVAESMDRTIPCTFELLTRP